MSGHPDRERAQRMESVGQLTGGMAHDFNNLLTVIQGNLQALQDLPTVRADAACMPLINAALRASQRGAELTRSLLAFSRRQKLAPASVDALAMLRSLLAMLERTVDQRVRLELKTTSPCPECVADPALLESALLNIALNACDAMPGGGTLSCCATLCEVLPESLCGVLCTEEQSTSGYVAISMRDSGTGMSPAVRERVFEPFFTTKEPGRGTGLGLSTVYGFVSQSHGAIDIESAPGEGTCITLYLPRERRTIMRPMAPRVASLEALQQLDVMLIEDDLEVMAVALSMLGRLGCRVRAFASGEHALMALERDPPPALLLSDVALGIGMPGNELARRVQARWPRVAVLLMSGYMPETVAPDAVATELLSKPFSTEQLAAAMLAALSSHQGTSMRPFDAAGGPSVKQNLAP